MTRSRGCLWVAVILLGFAFLAGLFAARDAAGATPPSAETLGPELDAVAQQDAPRLTLSGPCLPAEIGAAALAGEGLMLAAAGVVIGEGEAAALLELWRAPSGGWVLIYHTGHEGALLRCLIEAGPVWRETERGE